MNRNRRFLALTLAAAIAAVSIAGFTGAADKKPDFPEAEWPYSITVYACIDGAKAQKIAAVDPRIIWKD